MYLAPLSLCKISCKQRISFVKKVCLFEACIVVWTGLQKPISTGFFASNSTVNAATATGTPISTVTGMGSTGKDVQPKSPGTNDEDDGGE